MADGLTVEESMIDAESGKRILLKIKAHPAICYQQPSMAPTAPFLFLSSACRR